MRSAGNAERNRAGTMSESKTGQTKLAAKSREDQTELRGLTRPLSSGLNSLTVMAAGLSGHARTQVDSSIQCKLFSRTEPGESLDKSKRATLTCAKRLETEAVSLTCCRSAHRGSRSGRQTAAKTTSIKIADYLPDDKLAAAQTDASAASTQSMGLIDCDANKLLNQRHMFDGR